MSTPKISVIVPVYNVERYLPCCIDSILAQTLADFELLLIDDGSKDRSGEICDEYARKDSRIRVFHKPNGGVTAARRDGVNMAMAGWIMFVDADDMLEKDALQTMWGYCDGADIVKASFVGSDGRQWQHVDIGAMTSEEFMQSLADGNTYGVVYASLYKRGLFRESTFSFPRDIKIGEDVLMNMELAQRVTKVVNIEDVVYWYRTNAGSVMNSMLQSPLYLDRYFSIRNTMLSDSQCRSLALHDLDCRLASLLNPNMPFRREYADVVLMAAKTVAEYGLPLSWKVHRLLVMLRYRRVFSFCKQTMHFVHKALRRMVGKRAFVILD